MDEKLTMIREKILDYYGLDINEAKCCFSTRNYAFIFRESPYMIRVSIGPSKSRQETLSEVLWVDDLKLFSDTICEPSPSKMNHHIEEFEVDGVSYRTAMFRTARGNVKDIAKMEPMYFIAVGDLLGRIHAASTDSAKQGIRYKRPTWEARDKAVFEAVGDKIDPAILERINRIYEEIRVIPRDDGSFGMIHGDFHNNNFFSEGNNIWVFDFDDCCYGYYMMDIATVLAAWLMTEYKADKPRRKVLYEDILPYLSIGYGLHMKLKEDPWKNLELFIQYRQAEIFLLLTQASLYGAIAQEMEIGGQLCAMTLRYDDILEGLDELMRQATMLVPGSSEQQESKHTPEAGAAGKSAVIPVCGRLSTDTAPALDGQIQALINSGCNSLVLDLQDLSYMSSAGIRVLIKVVKRIPEFRLIHANEFVREVLEMTGLIDMLEVSE